MQREGLGRLACGAGQGGLGRHLPLHTGAGLRTGLRHGLLGLGHPLKGLGRLRTTGREGLLGLEVRLECGGW